MKVPLLNFQDVDSDLTLLRRVFENAYGGKGVLPKAQYELIVRGLDQLSRSRTIWASDSLCDALSSITERINDFHLTVNIEGRVCGRVWPNASVGWNIGNGNANPTWTLISKPIREKSVDILAVKKMTSALSSDWNGFLESVGILMEKNSSFIIDLRGNAGGDVQKGLEMSARLFGLKNVESIPGAKKITYRKQTPEAIAIMANAFWLQKQKYEAENLVPPPYLMSQINYAHKWYQKAIRKKFPLQTMKMGNVKLNLSQAFSKPIYILIDRFCGSSCELILEALEIHPQVITVGENTTGVVQFGNVGRVYLPNSHIVVNIPTQGSVYQDGRKVEKIGYAPMHRVPSGQDALDFTLNKFFTE